MRVFVAGGRRPTRQRVGHQPSGRSHQVIERQDADTPAPRRPIRSLRVVAPVVGSLVSVLSLTGCGASHGAAPASGAGTVIDRLVPSSIRSLPFREASGRTITLDDLRGKTVVISDSMTLCSEDCPLDTANLVSAARAADAAGLSNKVEFLTITVDPARDDPRHLAAYRKLYDPHHRLRNWQLLTGTQAVVSRLWKYFGVYWEKVAEDSPPDHDWLTGKPLTYDIAHADEVLMLDPTGRERYVISGHAHVPASEPLPRRMREYLSPEGRRHLLRPGAATWTPDDVLEGVGRLTGHPIAGS